MHPALSVILFTTLSGTGYGLLVWLGVRVLLPATALPQGMPGTGTAWWVAMVLITVGLLASIAHLGKPLRAWRAFSQWRSSWLSREGMLAVATYVPAFGLLLLDPRDHGVVLRVVAVLTIVLALATVACTAMIYASLAPIAAWQNRWVLPGYLGFALIGGLWPALLLDVLPITIGTFAIGALGSAALLVLKLRYWRAIDATPYASNAEAATGLGRFGRVRSFEAPHTEANYLLREMGFVLARRHARRLRRHAIVLGCVTPPLLCLAAMLAMGPWLLLAIPVFQWGIFVERWLFFAQARHTVTLYYRAGEL